NGLKSIVKSYSNSKTSQRITSDFKKIKFSQNGRIKSFLIAGIEKELKTYKKIDFEDYRNCFY
ncbi:MAG: hypothetical protein GY830_02645, partial [Bacteroidetes bacterium]|nr:hypothetical protein [Bacteroidota bacterium]